MIADLTPYLIGWRGYFGFCQTPRVLTNLALADAQAFAMYLAPLRRTEWVVYAKRPFGGPQAVLAYLSRYTHRVAIADSRLSILTPRGEVPVEELKIGELVDTLNGPLPVKWIGRRKMGRIARVLPAGISWALAAGRPEPGRSRTFSRCGAGA